MWVLPVRVYMGLDGLMVLLWKGKGGICDVTFFHFIWVVFRGSGKMVLETRVCIWMLEGTCHPTPLLARDVV